MNNKKYQQLKKVIQEAVPEREELYRCNRVWQAWQVGTMTESDFEIVEEPIRLADVLVTVNNTKLHITCDGRIIFNGIEVVYWNLKNNNLDNQSDECKEFLCKLLKPLKQ